MRDKFDVVRGEAQQFENLEQEWEALRDRIIAGCDLDPLGVVTENDLQVRVHKYFGDSQDPPPVLVLSKDAVMDHLAVTARQAGSEAEEPLRFAAMVLATNLDEEFDADHGDRRLRRVGLQKDRTGSYRFIAEYD